MERCKGAAVRLVLINATGVVVSSSTAGFPFIKVFMKEIEKPKLEIIDSKNVNFSSFIISKAEKFEDLIVFTYGVNPKELKGLCNRFETVSLLIDESHRRLNPTQFEKIFDMSRDIDGLIVKVAANHSKMAILNRKTVIITSANLTCNRRAEMYLTADVDCIEGVQDMIDFFDNVDFGNENVEQSHLVEKNNAICNSKEKRDCAFDFDISFDF